MIKGTNFSLVYDLFDHLFIFNEKNEIIYEGNSLKKLLTEFTEKLSDRQSGELSELYSLIEKVRKDNEPRSYKFPGIIDEFILFPSKMDEVARVILAKKDKIIQIPKIEFDLNERVKELECLYRISTELVTANNFDEAITNCIKHTEDGFQFPETTKVNIEFNKKLFGDISFDPADVKDTLISEIKVDDQKKGEIRVNLFHNNGFLEEEKKLINEISGKLALAIEENQKTINLEKQSKILRRKNEALLRLTEECYQRREKLRTFFSAITDNIVVINHDYDILMSNNSEIGDSGKCYEKLFNEKKRCEKCPAKITFESAENNIQGRQEGDKYFNLRAYPIFNKDGKVDRVLEVCQEVTNQKKMEAQLLQSYKLASLGKLVAGVAHEINNPNTFILGNLKIIQEAINDIFPVLDEYSKNNEDLTIARLKYDLFKENISTLIEDMINGANRTKKIVSDLRNFAKKDDGTLTEKIDINSMIKNDFTLTRKHIKKYAQLEVELADNVPLFIGSSTKLEQVLLNLIMNASESIENGSGFIKIKTDYDKNSNEVIVIVEDNGCGMDESTIHNIFDPFFTTKRNSGGTGLGLSITYGIIKDHNGKIDVRSKLGEGTVFTLRFPAGAEV